MAPVSTITPPSGVPQVPLDRVPALPVAQAVATVLSPAKSVTAVNTSSASDNEAGSPASSPFNSSTPAPAPAASAASSSDNYQHTVILDPGTQDLIFRVVDVRTRQVIRQVPEEAMLRMHAYARALADGKSNTAALNQANLEV